MRQVEAGEDPSEARDTAKAAPTVDMLCDRFLLEVEAKRKQSTADEYRALLKRSVRPVFGKLKVAEVTQAMVLAWHMAKSGTPYEANRAAVVAKRMWNLADKWGLARGNPFKAIELYRERPRDRVPSAPELEAIGRAMGEVAVASLVRRCIILLATRRTVSQGCRIAFVRHYKVPAAGTTASRSRRQAAVTIRIRRLTLRHEPCRIHVRSSDEQLNR